MSVRRVLDFWRYGGRWWQGESPRNYYLVELDTGHVFEVYQEVPVPGGPDRAGTAWVLSRVAD